MVPLFIIIKECFGNFININIIIKMVSHHVFYKGCFDNFINIFTLFIIIIIIIMVFNFFRLS
jgi:hypothetical protein